MKLLLLLVAASLTAPAFAQQYDFNGDEIGAGGGVGNNAPGNLLLTITGQSARYNDLAYDGEYLLAFDGVLAAIHVIIPWTGAEIATVPTLNSSDFGLGWDDQRELFVVTNASTDIVYTYTRAGVLVSSWPFPSTGFVGAAWDCRRDVYWVLDWSADTVTAVDPLTGAPSTVFSTSAIGCTRGAGLGYDANTDTLYMGGRDQRAVFGMDAATGGIVCSFPGDQASASNPHGITVSPRGGVWEGTYQGAGLMHEYEGCTPTHPTLRVVPVYPTAGGICVLTVEGMLPFERFILAYSLTGCGPTPSPIGDMLLSNPRSVIGIFTALGSGANSVGSRLPAILAGRTVYLHGGGLGGSGRCNNVIINP